MDVSAPRHFRNLTLTLAAILAFVVGCESGSQPNSATKNAGTNPGQRGDRSDVLFSAVVEQMRDLAAYVDTDLTPPAVILDSKKSGDQKDVLAVCSTQPHAPEGPINYLQVRAGNSRFRSLGVRPGDLLKYFVLLDKDSAETGISREVALDLVVAQVLSDNTLLIEGGISQQVTEPAKIEIWRYVGDRLADIKQQFDLYVGYRKPPLDWEPSPDSRVIKQIVERLNQWMRQSEPSADWTADELLATIDPELANDDRLAPMISDTAMADTALQSHEGRLLQEALWLRDISRWAQGDSLDPVPRATALFDWTIRNIQLDADANALPYRPWQILVHGHGTAEQRAWVFALLCRQQGLNVVVLSLPAASGPAVEAAKTRFWLPALLSDGQLYLFDTRLGLPITGPGGEGIATLENLRADEKLLRQLDLDDTRYPVTKEDLDDVTAGIVTDPFDLSRRARAIEAKLSGDDHLVLASHPSELAANLKDISGISSVKLWDFPFATLRDQLRAPQAIREKLAEAFQPFAWRPQLWKARVLHFQGHRRAEVNSQGKALDEYIEDHNQALQLYTNKTVRPPDHLLDTMGSSAKRKIYTDAKADAGYWVGLLLFDQGKFATAENWFHNPQIAAGGDEPWAAGTRYNLARTYEAEGKNDDAIALYEKDKSPQRDGNRLRARWLKNQPKPAKASGDMNGEK